MLVAGVVASVIVFQGIQAVALPLVQEFGYTKEIEDRVLAPLPVQLVAIEKIRAALTPVDHMSLWAVYPVLIAFTALFTWQGMRGFMKRVLA